MNEENQSKINALKNLLEQNDYIGRKVVFEVAAKLKEKFPDVEMPVYEKYLETETLANTFRQEIDSLSES